MKDYYIKIKRSDLIIEIITGIALLMFFLAIISAVFDLDPFNTDVTNLTKEEKAFYEKHPDYPSDSSECYPDLVYGGCF